MKISDFGAAKEQTDKKTHITPGTLAYASPQQIRCQQHTEKCDVYALGCMFFQFLVGFPPTFAGCVKGSNVMDMKKVNKKLQKKKVPKEMVEFLEGCLRLKEYVYTNKDGK